MKPPKKWKMAIVIWLAIYPLITIVFLSFGKYLVQINPIPLRTLVMTIILVPTMVFLLMPAIMKILGDWLRK
jgi:antibiotic biosynthesis monooxygenase (ABM) superfamily enzyme